jgi:DNA-binding NarL/FixJ family response regulator
MNALTECETEVLKLLAHGRTNRQIVETLVRVRRR